MTYDQQRAILSLTEAKGILRERGENYCAILIADAIEIITALRAAPEWEPIDTAPKDDRMLVRCESGSVYAAHWVQNPMTGDEAWLVCALEDGTQMLVHPVEWMPLPFAAAPEMFVLVPVEPTQEMLDAGGPWNTEMDEPPDFPALRCIWRDMLAARPQGVKDAP